MRPARLSTLLIRTAARLIPGPAHPVRRSGAPAYRPDTGPSGGAPPDHLSDAEERRFVELCRAISETPASGSLDGTPSRLCCPCLVCGWAAYLFR